MNKENKEQKRNEKNRKDGERELSESLVYKMYRCVVSNAHCLETCIMLDA